MWIQRRVMRACVYLCAVPVAVHNHIRRRHEEELTWACLGEAHSPRPAGRAHSPRPAGRFKSWREHLWEERQVRVPAFPHSIAHPSQLSP